ncbi:hypothetical protein ACUNWD_16250 [Sunxiuqinia sp. A32]|uniref:hypothetical protein n=1 Tax=Sunxiuqinia sp. A32 TaxID=3461496 RepID=UPI004045D729
MSITVDWKNNGAFIKIEGILDFEVVMEANDLLIGDPRFDAILYQIWDFREIKSVSIEVEDAKTIATVNKAATRWTKNVYVGILANINQNNLQFFELYRKTMQDTAWQYGIFQNYKDLTDWLESSLGKKFS